MKSVFSVEAILQRSLLKQGQSNPRNTVVPSENYRLVQSRGRKQSNFCDVPFLLTWSCQNLKIIKKNHGQLSTLILSNPFFYLLFKMIKVNSVFRLRIRLDSYHLAGTGSTSENVDSDPCSKKNRDKLTYKSTKIIRI